ncbi:uncharacterized protein LOC141727708 [Zonotrichia albicollis]|uniref:uncharacterized protein LOC141727708 n=1 Tax=Zonotrichia albicollis TaxID=44394 RepID=UPI003D80D430
MEATSPSLPIMSWEKPRVPKKSKYEAEPIEMTRVEQLNDCWIPTYARHFVEFIYDFATDPSKFQEEEQKEEFLHNISNLCRESIVHVFSEDLTEFSNKYNLVDLIETMLNLEPKDEIRNRLRRLAMLAFAGLSTIGALLDIKKVLRLCFNSVFFLRPSAEMPEEQENLCTRALLTMDTMLQVMMLNTPGAKRSEMMQDILEVLLEYLLSDRAEVQERAMDRIKALCHMLTDTAPKEDDEDEDEEEAPRAQIQIPVLGKLLGNLVFMLFKPNESMSTVVEILSTLMAFLSEQKSDNPESYVQPPEDWEPEITSWVNASNAWKVEAFGRYLGPDERMGVVLEAIEILGRFNIKNKDGPVAFLEEVMNTPEMWLMDVPKVVRHIFQYYNEQNTATADNFHSLVIFMADKWTDKVVTTALEATPIFSDNVSLWKAMFSVRETLEKVVKELQIQVQDWQDDILTGQQKSCLTFLAMLTYGDVLEKRVRPLYKNMRLVKSPKKEMVPLVLRALETLSESDDMAKKMKSLLPEMLKFLGNWSWDISVMALDIFRNVLGQLKKKEASSMALKAVERLWKLFDAREECLRERSISLFKELLGKTTWKDKEAMKRNSWKVMVQLVLHISDEAPSVAKASKEAVMAIAKLFKWKEFKELAQKEEIWKMSEFLVRMSPRLGEGSG